MKLIRIGYIFKKFSEKRSRDFCCWLCCFILGVYLFVIGVEEKEDIKKELKGDWERSDIFVSMGGLVSVDKRS